MAYQFTIEPKSSYLHFTVTGDNTADSMSGYLRDVYLACKQSGCPRVLIEENLVGPSLSVTDVFDVVTERTAGIFPVVRTVAFVDLNPTHDKTIQKFGENVAVNRGVHVRVFTNVTEAEEWLSAMGDQ